MEIARVLRRSAKCRPGRPGQPGLPVSGWPVVASRGAVKVGDTVLRPARPWSASVQSVLRFLADAGFSGAPRALGFDEHGREVQSFLAGETIGTQDPWPDWVRSDRALIQVARWTRDLHDTTAAFVPEPGARWYTGRAWEPGLVIGHQDASPFNAVWSGADLVGFVDWDWLAVPAEMDLAYVALCWVPLFASRLTGGSGVDGRSASAGGACTCCSIRTGTPAIGANSAGRSCAGPGCTRRSSGRPPAAVIRPTARCSDSQANSRNPRRGRRS